MKFDNYSFV